ncbi:MAG: hypothetical protein J0L96_05540 [Anaerolineae bacterium]|mgnify:CR=1 FL=1|jgi:hypothetical protein|nr:hypothetical protein [Anaerolineae bacterium]
MTDKEKKRQRFLRDPLERRLGGLAATLARISSSARNSESPIIVENLLDEAKHYIEWTAADAEAETAAELVQMQRLITLWQKSWKNAFQDVSQRVVLSTLAKEWSDKALESSGLV